MGQNHIYIFCNDCISKLTFVVLGVEPRVL